MVHCTKVGRFLFRPKNVAGGKYNLIIAIYNIAKGRNLSKTIINIVENIIYNIDIFLFLHLKKVL